MNPTLSALFPNMSRDCRDVNQDSAVLTLPADQNEPTVARKPRKRGLMNNTESEFALILEAMKRKGEIRDWEFESVKIRIGEGCWYCPDFVVQRPAGEIVFKEVKGFLRDDARVKFLAAKEQHQWAEWEMWRKDRKTGWTQIL